MLPVPGQVAEAIVMTTRRQRRVLFVRHPHLSVWQNVAVFIKYYVVQKRRVATRWSLWHAIYGNIMTNG